MTNSYLISFSYGKGCYRHIRIAATATLYQLHEAIIAAFEFIDDHAHIFFMNNRVWDPADAYVSSKMEPNDRLTRKYTLKGLGLVKGKAFKYIFDYGEEHRFQCRVLQELREKTDFPGVVREVGESPEQYPDWDDDFDDDDDDDDDDDLPSDDGEDDTARLPEVYSEQKINRLLDQLSLAPEVVGQLFSYFAAAARLYGTLPLGELLKIYNSQNDPISEADFLSLAEIFYHDDLPFVILGEEHLYSDGETVPPIEREVIDIPLVAVSMEVYYVLKEGQQGKPYAILPKKEFLQYADPDWYPKTAQSEAIEKYLRKKKLPLCVAVKDLMVDLHFMAAIDAPLDMSLELLAKNGIKFTDINDTHELIALLQDFSDHTRKQINRGNMPRELSDRYRRRN